MKINSWGMLASVFALFIGLSVGVQAKDEIKLEVTVIKGNTELPKFLYIVPWQSGEGAKIDEQKLVLHGLFMGVLDPVLPRIEGITQEIPVVAAGQP